MFLIETRIFSMDMLLPQWWYVYMCVCVRACVRARARACPHAHIFPPPLPIFFLAREVSQAVTIHIELRSQASRLLAVLAITTAGGLMTYVRCTLLLQIHNNYVLYLEWCCPIVQWCIRLYLAMTAHGTALEHAAAHVVSSQLFGNTLGLGNLQPSGLPVQADDPPWLHNPTLGLSWSLCSLLQKCVAQISHMFCLQFLSFHPLP